jgi:hypothetical protein
MLQVDHLEVFILGIQNPEHTEDIKESLSVFHPKLFFRHFWSWEPEWKLRANGEDNVWTSAEIG